jgi:pyruvate/2-oxoglutarate dehydrogenase complex dihydrolipoamide dehydrogenase (E3) component
MRIVRVAPVVTGARIGTPKNVMVLPETTPWNTFGVPTMEAVGLDELEAAAKTVPAVMVALPPLITA